MTAPKRFSRRKFLKGGISVGVLQAFSQPAQAIYNTFGRYINLAAKVPAGTVLAWKGTTASIPADWLLCDGTNGTPDLSNRFIIGSGGGYTKGSSGQGGITGTSSTAGAHTGGAGLIGSGGSGSGLYGDDSGGDHAHALGGTLDAPPHYTLAYIRASVETEIPVSAVVWSNKTSLGSAYNVCTELSEKFICGVTNDSRAAAGSDTRNYVIEIATAGNHQHGVGDVCCAGSGTQNHGMVAAGAHTHTGTGFTGTQAMARPPYLALTPLECVAKTKASSGLIVAYDGDIANLPAGWKLCDGSGGTVDLAGRFPMGAGGSYTLNSVGGQFETFPLSGTLASYSASHHHRDLVWNTPYPGSANHMSYTWTHSHTYTGSLDSTPPYYCLHYIMRSSS